MITVIIGKAGTGKSTIARMLSSSYDRYIEADEEVKKAYREKKIIEFFSNHEILRNAIVDQEINKDKLIGILVSDKETKIELEDYLFSAYIVPTIRYARHFNKSLLIDGIVPRFTSHFDQVIEMSISDDIRKAHLRKRGVSEQRIEELFELQKEIKSTTPP